METEIHYITETMETDEQDWSFQENKKRQVWSDEETLALLKCMQRRDILEGNLSDSKFAATLVKPMETLGFVRTPHQIKIKMKSLRQSYHQCKKNGCTPAAMKDCPYYDVLASIYEDRKTLSDSDTEPNDSNVWTENEIMKMLSIIDELNLVHELSLHSFSMGALRLVTKALKSYGYDRNVNQVKLALMSLKTTYIESKLGVLHGESEKCLYFEILDEIWGSDEVSLRRSNESIQSKSQNQEKLEFWSEEETVVLLELVRKLKIEPEAFKCSDYAANQLQEALQANGHIRNWKQVKNKLSNLKRSFFEVKQSGSSKLISGRFPFYQKYEETFRSEIETSDIHFVTYEESNGDEVSHVVPNSGRREKKKQNRGPAWSEEETILVLALLQELDLIDEFKDRMTLEAVSKLVEPLAKQGFNRTASQIKIKMKNLRTSYQRCIQAGCTPQALAECPFYNRLHAIFDKVPGTPKTKKLETIQRLEPVDREVYGNVENISDHSYNVRNTCKKIKMEENGKEVWYPVEAIESITGTNEENCKFEKYNEEVAAQSDSEDSHVTGFEEVDEGEYLDSRNLEMPYQSHDASSSNLEKIDASTSFRKDSKENEDARQDTESARKLSDALSEDIVERDNSDLKEILKLSKQNLFVSSDTSETGPKRTLSQQTNFGSQDSKTNCQSCVKAMKQIMSDVLRHDKLMQQRHQIWMERQFELQRKHDREQRELLLNELREFRQLIASSRDIVQDDKS